MHEITVGTDLLESNETWAKHNREHFTAHGVYVCNIMSGPGAGKTTLLEQTLRRLNSQFVIAVIEGDVQTEYDAERIRQCGVSAVQINTGGACHLDARLVHHHLSHFELESLDVLIIENVGNLVCPAEFDLGENDRVMLLSVTEGDDKPEKYPVMFHESDLLVINKVDLLPYTDFNVATATRRARALNADLDVIALSARTGEGVDEWCQWLTGRMESFRRGKC